MTATDLLAPQKVEQTIFGLISTWLARGSQDIVGQYPSITVSNGYKVFIFEGIAYNVVARADGDVLITPGVNVYFGSHVPDSGTRVKPQIIHTNVVVHISVPWKNEPTSASKLAMRIGSTIEQAFEGLGAMIQVCDCSVSPPEPTSKRFVSWARMKRFDWREAGDPIKGMYTNRIGTRNFRYTR